MKPSHFLTRPLSHLLGFCLLLFAAICLTGCTTSGVYDPVKTAKVQASVKPVVAALVRAEVAAQPQNVTYIRSVGNVFCQMQTNGNFTPAYLTAEINKLTTPLVHDQIVLLVRDTLISLYEINYADRFKAELAPDKWPAFLAELMCGGINAGLQ